MDYEYLRGSIKSKQPDITPGIEAVGIIEKVGADVDNFKKGQRVAYATILGGAFAECRCIKSKHLVPVHDTITDEAAALNLAKGMTAHFLMRRTFFLRHGMIMLIHGAASNVGKLMIAYAKANNIEVIATVGSDDKKDLVKKLGAGYVFNYNSEHLTAEINQVTKKKGVHVVYDFIGGNLLKDSLKCLMPFGLLVSAGNASGISNPISPSILSKKSLFLASPRLHEYKKDRHELFLSAVEVYGLIEKQIFPATADKTYNFDEIPEAMDDIASRKSMSKVVLLN
jgi:NADPH2:quinone reductase